MVAFHDSIWALPYSKAPVGVLRSSLDASSMLTTLVAATLEPLGAELSSLADAAWGLTYLAQTTFWAAKASAICL